MKTTFFTTVMSLALFISLSSFTPISGSPLLPTSKVNIEPATTSLEIDVNQYMAALGLTTSVDEKALETQYPSVAVEFLGGDGVEIKFANPTAQYYRLDIYDLDGNVLVSYEDIYGDTVKVDNRFVAATGSYIYKLVGEGNTYAGKFSAQIQ